MRTFGMVICSVTTLSALFSGIIIEVYAGNSDTFTRIPLENSAALLIGVGVLTGLLSAFRFADTGE